MRNIAKFIQPLLVAIIYGLAAWFCVRQLALAHLAVESMRQGIIRPFQPKPAPAPKPAPKQPSKR